MQSTIETIAHATLERIEEGRKLKARCGLDDDKMRVSIVAYHGTTGVDAIVSNGNSYEVYLSEQVASCSCKDYEHRQQPCKHIAATCFYLLGSTAPDAKEPPFSIGQDVQKRGLPERHGKVVCVSDKMVSVRWEPIGYQPAYCQAYNEVELEPARTMPAPKPIIPGAVVEHRTLRRRGIVRAVECLSAIVLWDHGYEVRTALDKLQAA